MLDETLERRRGPRMRLGVAQVMSTRPDLRHPGALRNRRRTTPVKLYSGPLSLFTAKVRIALKEKALDYERIEVPFSRARGYEPKHPDVLRLNPKAQVPVLVDGDLALYDSTLILEYLEDRHPEPPLLPGTAEERARCRQLELHADEVLFPPVLELIRAIFYVSDPAQQDAARIAAARETLGKLYEELDARLTGHEWFCDRFSVADIACVLVILFASRLGAPPRPDLGRLQAWLERAAARPSIASEIREVTAFAATLRE